MVPSAEAENSMSGNMSAPTRKTVKQIVTLLFGCLIALTAVAGASATSQIFQMRLVLSRPSGDSEQMVLYHKFGGKFIGEALYVQKKVLLNQTALESVKVITDSLGHPQIQITFTKAGRQRFAEVTRDSIHRRLAIIIDGQLCEAPIIQAEIPGGIAEISGSFSKQEAEQLASKIRESLRKR
jgi:preprotein translocase subunit SecD